jgi:hypothetical protein
LAGTSKTHVEITPSFVEDTTKLMSQLEDLHKDAQGEARIFTFALGRKRNKEMADERKKKAAKLNDGSGSTTTTGAGVLMNCLPPARTL